MRVQLVTDDMPALGLGISGDHGLHMGPEIGLRPCGASIRGHQLARDDIAAQNKAARAMTYILELAPLDFTGSERQSGMLARQSTRQCSRSLRPLVPAVGPSHTSYR